MKTCSLNVAASALALTGLLAPVSNAAVVYDVQFDSGADGWTAAIPANISGLGVSGGTLNGTAVGNDPQLSRAGSLTRASGESWDTLTFRVREVQDEAPAGVVTTFNPTGLVVAFGGVPGSISSGFTAVDSGAGYFTVTLDISGVTQDTFTSVRLDPIGGASSNSNSQTDGNTFEVDFITITDTAPIPEPASAALVGLGALLIGGRRRRA